MDDDPICWHHETSEPPSVLAAAIEAVAAAMTAEGYSADDVFAMRLAMAEAVVNARKHGSGGDAAKPVRVRYHVNPERALAEVEDLGPGFDPRRVPDPLAPENRDRPSGRGLLLMRAYLTWCRHNRRGNCVTLCRRRSAG